MGHHVKTLPLRLQSSAAARTCCIFLRFVNLTPSSHDFDLMPRHIKLGDNIHIMPSTASRRARLTTTGTPPRECSLLHPPTNLGAIDRCADCSRRGIMSSRTGSCAHPTSLFSKYPLVCILRDVPMAAGLSRMLLRPFLAARQTADARDGYRWWNCKVYLRITLRMLQEGRSVSCSRE